MGTDHIIFIHGVDTRQPNYADKLINGLKQRCPSLKLHFIPLFWGDISDEQENILRQEYASSSTWTQFWFQKFRSNLAVEFIGDIALYASRYVGAQVVARLRSQIESQLQNNFNENEDTIHIIAHSLGCVVLFDLLFSTRWNPPDEPGHDDVLAIRRYIYGVAPQQNSGLRLGSLHTMGAPIGIYSLLEVRNPADKAKKKNNGEPLNSHDVTPGIQTLISHLRHDQKMAQPDKPLPWLNFAHPGDPIGSPLEGLLPGLLDGEEASVALSDIVLKPSRVMDYINIPLRQSILPLLNSSAAHSCYWTNQQVIKTISDVFANNETRSIQNH